jgi:hypothetical protein
MVQHESAGAFAGTWRAGNNHHRRTLGISAGGRIDDIEGPCPVGHDRDAKPEVIARCRIGGEAYCRLVRQREMRENAALFDHLVERQNEVARYSEDFPGAVVLQALQERVRELGHCSNVPEFMPPRQCRLSFGESKARGEHGKRSGECAAHP